MDTILHKRFRLKFNPSLILLSFLFLCGLCHADPPYHYCPSNTTSTYSENSPFEKNLKKLIVNLNLNSSSSKFYKTWIGTNDSDVDRVYGLFMCFDYVSQDTCQGCIKTASGEVMNSLCPASTAATVWEENCQLRYSGQDFFGRLDNDVLAGTNFPQWNDQNISRPVEFRSTVDKALRNLSHVASYKGGGVYYYASGEVAFEDKPLYAMVQCTGDLSPDQCRSCLGNSTKKILDLYQFSIGARLYARSCYLRYELYPFNKDKSEDLEKGRGERKRVWKVVLLIAGSASLVIAVLGWFAFYYLFKKRNQKANNDGEGQMRHESLSSGISGRKDFPCIRLASILAATNSFSESNKLGQGGFGPVYKGILKEGKEVAVKRLSFCSEQGSEEFTNEVLLIMNLQHKNLVKLLGFCVERDEKLLVYEYMPNKSLDIILFNPSQRVSLDWETRINICTGIARGILYLHEDSRVQIIHRDLKASNILLDCDMTPKISDFGMARIFAGSEDQANTATIVGTYGYMAPEYAMEGIYSIKSDVFSFGVLLFELMTGKNNANFHRTQLAPSLLAYAWHLWQTGLVSKLIDPSFACSHEIVDEFLRYIHIGLLCVQEDAYDRPNMSSVVVMLTSKSSALNQPKRPAFFTGRIKGHGKSLVDTNSSVNNFTVSNVMPR